jgi:asparagine synthase (glutamine-hydrolysing)
MCGITGMFRANGAGGVSPETLQRMTSVLDHRGPDESGIYVDDRTGLGHTRLSIIDLSTGQQPMSNGDETLWMVYNGEIFNYIELRTDLEAKGRRFLTTSDTEVLIQMYEEYGADCLARLNGQFAFAIWDTRKKEMFLARDRMGIRPLHYAWFNDTLYFASEVKSIFYSGEVPREIDPLAIDQIFTFWAPLPGRTAFTGVSELLPGHYMTVNADQIQIGRYWNIPLCAPEDCIDRPLDTIAAEIREKMLDAVRLRLRADVPVGTYLSGGLDSSGVTALVVQNFDSDVRTFGIRFEEDEFDEGEYQQQMVSFLKTTHSEIHAGNDAIGAAFPDVVWHCEKPVLRTAPAPLYLLSRLVREHDLKVVLTGEGADEVFGGYNIFREAKVRKFWSKEPDSKIRPELIGKLYPYIFQNPRLKKSLQAFFARGIDRPDDPLFSHMIRWNNTSKIKLFFSSDLRSRIGDYDGFREVARALPRDYERWDCVVKAQYLEMIVFLSNYLLSSQGDRVAMANSLEIRLPYLDPNVMEYMSRVPSKWKIFGLDEKHILKRSFRGVLPDSIASRNKHPYRAPISNSLLGTATAGYTDDLLSEKKLGAAGLFDPGKVGKLVELLRRPGGGSEVNNMALVGILSAQLVHDRFVANFPAGPAGPDKPARLIDRRTRTEDRS